MIENGGRPQRVDEADLRARAAECRSYAAACGHPRLAAVALDLAEAFEAEAEARAADAGITRRRAH
jgi:hypothetical protein